MANRMVTVRARTLRQNSTDAERLLWSRLRSRQLGEKFVRQFPIGPFVVDFACRAAKLVVELDGGQHADASAKDAERTQHIAALGYHVVRFWNNEVVTNLDGVLLEIASVIAVARNDDPERRP